jgi:hypothetical protein
VFTASGGSSPVRFAVTSGVLPEGLSLSASGILAGTPTSTGRHAFSVSALDATGCATSRAVTLDVQGCAFTLSPASASIGAGGADVTVTVGDPCGPHTVDVADTFVTVQSNTTGHVVLGVAPNHGGSSRSATITIGRRAFVINQGGLAAQPPFGYVDGPADGTRVSGSVAVGGWALDDLEVRRVRLTVIRSATRGPGNCSWARRSSCRARVRMCGAPIPHFHSAIAPGGVSSF